MVSQPTYSLPSKKAIRNQVALHGKRNDLRQVNEHLLTTLLGHPPATGKCYIRFVPGRQLDVKKYADALVSLKAATNSLATIIQYVQKGDDPLLIKHWEHFLRFAEYGNQIDMDICKEILTYVKCIEDKDLTYPILGRDTLSQLARYHTIRMYPKDYVMRFDIINEYDRYIPDEDKWMYEDEYRAQYLADHPYTAGHGGFLYSISQALNTQVDYMIENKMAKNYFMKFFKPDCTLLDQSNDTRCAAGSKRLDFWNILALGVTLELSPIINGHIDVLNRLYNLHMDYPRITPNGMTVAEYLPQLIIQEDPKKRRTAYKSNPIIDMIGAVGMDATKYMFAYFPNIKCGRKRLTNTDYIEDMSRYDTIKQLYQDAKEQNLALCSTDLSSCTENLNMVDYKEMLAYRLKRIRDKLQLAYSDTQITDRVNDCCDILYKTGITLSEDPEQGRVYYMSKGQMAGVRMSFHAMTDQLSTIQVQALLNKFRFEHKTNCFNWCLENGDDGVILEPAFEEFCRLLTLTAPDPNVINREKSYNSTKVKFVEFCKTLYFDFPNEPITGYRYCSLYKLTREPKDVIHLIDGHHEYERKLFIWFLENWEHEDDFKNMLNWEQEEYCRFLATYRVLTDQDVAHTYNAVLLWRAIQLQYIAKHGNIAEKIALDPRILSALPREMDNITPKDTYYLVKDGRWVMHADYKLLDALEKTIVDDFNCGTLVDWIISPYHYNVAKLKFEEVSGLQWDDSCRTTGAIDTPMVKLIPVSQVTAQNLGIPDTRVAILIGYQGSHQISKDLILEKLSTITSTNLDVETFWQRTEVIPFKTNKMVINDKLLDLGIETSIESMSITPTLSMDEIIESIYYHEGLITQKPVHYSKIVNVIPDMLKIKDIRSALIQRSAISYNNDIRKCWTSQSKWRVIQ